jgi:hypothetical protein
MQDSTTAPRPSKTFAVRLPDHQAQAIEEIARRDANSAGAVIRRLISSALRSEAAVTVNGH